MSDSFATTNNLDPEAGFTQGSPSVAQAANDLRAAAGEKVRELASTASAQASALKEKAVESAHQFREVAGEKASQFKATAAEKAEALKHAASERAHQFRETATEQWEDTRVKAKELHVTAEDYIRQNPTKSVLGALGVGFLIGLILRR
ncbi:MAG: DUF883 family protein [Akkermansiaceae bacterium]|nr:DUF883 family protein [Akkermansiaceae bacterium]